MGSTDCDIRPDIAIQPEHDARVAHRVAANLHTFCENRAEFPQTAVHGQIVDADIASIIAQIGQFATRTQVDPAAENRVSDVVEVRCLSPGQQQAMLDLTRMTDHRISADPGMASHQGAMANLTGDVCRPFDVNGGPDQAAIDDVDHTFALVDGHGRMQTSTIGTQSLQQELQLGCKPIRVGLVKHRPDRLLLGHLKPGDAASRTGERGE